MDIANPTSSTLVGRRLACELIGLLTEEWNAPTPESVADEDMKEFLLSRDPSTFRVYLERVNGMDAESRNAFLAVLADYIGSANTATWVGESYTRYVETGSAT